MMTEKEIAEARRKIEEEQVAQIGLQHLRRVSLVSSDVEPLFHQLERQYTPETMLSVYVCRAARLIRDVRKVRPDLGDALIETVVSSIRECFRTGETQCVVVTQRRTDEPK